jgi:hypothetical protein
MTGLSRAQVTRLLSRYKATGAVEQKAYRRHRFPQRYTAAEIELLASVDETHGTLSGPATQKILYREFHEYGDCRYERLAAVSPAHIYNLRTSRAYGKQRVQYDKTRPVQVAIGERRGRIHKDGPDTCGWTPCIRVTWTASKVFTTSTRWMR